LTEVYAFGRCGKGGFGGNSHRIYLSEKKDFRKRGEKKDALGTFRCGSSGGAGFVEIGGSCVDGKANFNESKKIWRFGKKKTLPGGGESTNCELPEERGVELSSLYKKGIAKARPPLPELKDPRKLHNGIEGELTN